MKIKCINLLVSLNLVLLLLCPSTIFSQVDFREETIYFLMTTRFFDGDPNNNAPTEWSSYNPNPQINPTITDPNDVTWRGDFKGLIQKLDYIKDLGFTAIWITPIVHNRSPLDYHGYHAWDFTKVDPRLESPGATFQDLINEIHSRDMKIVLDVVTNHAGRFGIKDVAEIKYNTNPDASWYADDNPNWEYDGLTPNPNDGLIWSRANLAKMPPPYNQNLAAYNFPGKESYVDTSDPEWYHHSGNGFAQGYDDIENLQNRALAGDTPDLNTGSQVVRDYLVNAYAKYINMGVDAFRWDTVKHMSKEDILYFYDAFKAINPDLFIFGEVAQKRHELHPVEETNPHYYTWRGAVHNSDPIDLAVIDFFGQATFHNTFEEGQSFSGVRAAARYDHLYSDPSTLVTWLDNHDFGPNNDWNRRYGGTDENLAACMNFMFTWRGIPTVYYGTEMRFKAGEYADIHNASGIEKSINETGRAYYGDVINQASDHKLYAHIKKLNAIRSAIPALQKGNWEWKDAPGNAVSYKRVHGNSEVVVGLAKDGDATFSITGITNGVYRDAVTGRELFATNGSLNFSVKSGSAGIYVLNGPGTIGSCNGGFFESCISGPSTPVAIINPNISQSENPINISLQGLGGSGGPYSIYYTTDGSIPTVNSLKYTGAFTITESTVIKAITYDSNNISSEVVEKNYRIGAIEGLKIFFKKPSDWSQVNVHYWNESPDVLPPSLWPGPQMNSVNNTDWYQYILEGVESTNLLFSDNGNNKTSDLSRSKDGWYTNGQWYDSNPDNTGSFPSLSIFPQGGVYSNGETVTVTLDATSTGNGPLSIYYTTDGTQPSRSSIPYTGAISVTTSTIIKAIAYDSENFYSEIISNTYTFSSSNDGMTIYYKGSLDTPNLYFWNTSPTSVVTTWPGESMISLGDDWYAYTLPKVSCTNIIFNNNGNDQTIDLSRCGDGWYYNGKWFDSNPEPSQNLTVHYKPDNYINPSIYYWNTTPLVLTTSWPGESMISEGEGWYRFTLKDTNCANLIFSDKGDYQTTNLNRCTEGWFYNGVWYDQKPETLKSNQITPFEESSVHIYPNPISKNSFVQLEIQNSSALVSIELYNVIGNKTLLFNKTLDTGTHEIPLYRKNITLAKGVYFCKININETVITKKIIVQ